MLKLYNKIVIRTPLFPVNYGNPKYYQRILKNPEFLVALKHSSENLFNKITSKALLNQSEHSALFSYVTRMTRRSTPFGFMAGCTIENLDFGKENQIKISSNKKLLFRQNGKVIFEELIKKKND